jgi:hypothetical protein
MTESPSPPSKAIQQGRDLVRRSTWLQTAVFRGLVESADRLGAFKNLAPERLGVLHRR